MHFVLGIIGGLAALSYYLFVLRSAGNVASEVMDMAGRFRGRMRRNAFRKRADSYVLGAVDDPVAAAAVTLVAISTEDRGMEPDLVRLAGEQISAICPTEKIEENIIFAQWAVGHGLQVPTIIDQMCETLSSSLNEAEKEQFCKMVLDATPEQDRSQVFRLRMEHLRRKLGLVVA